MDPQVLGLAMFAAVFVLLMVGFPVAFTLLGTAVAFAALGDLLGVFDLRLLNALPLRLLGLMEDDLLQAIPLFLFLGVILQRTTLAADLLNGLGGLFGRRAGGLGVATIIVSVFLAPTTGAIGATVLTIGLLALPTMLAAGYDRRLASGIVCSAGTLGTIIPPSIVLILLGSFMQSANIEAQVRRGVQTAQAMTVQDIYLGALAPVGLLLSLYLAYVVLVAIFRPRLCPPPLAHLESRPSALRLLLTIFVPMGLLALMLGLVISGLAYTVEAAATAGLVATAYAWLRRELNLARLAETLHLVMKLTAMVFMLLMGASTFSLVFRGFSGDLFVATLLSRVPGGVLGGTAVVMAIMFGLAFFLDALEIIFLVVPIAMPPLLLLGADPVWLALLTAINLQTAFLHPPFGFAIIFLRGVAPKEVKTTDIYWGVIPFILIQLSVLALVWAYPGIVGLFRAGP
ncbi:MAG TPA: TRAP transporter large permease subunit [Stellaceae bacterium]|nr:TRAP transporter large permease subunit [Stellaceae bacterium]